MSCSRMPETPSDITTNSQLAWAGRVWSGLTRIQCAGVLHIALRYGERESDTNAYIDSMANLAWADLGRPLQADIASAFLELQKALGR